jgi:hypothetical protein
MGKLGVVGGLASASLLAFMFAAAAGGCGTSAGVTAETYRADGAVSDGTAGGNTPHFYFVVHADPARTSDLTTHFTRLDQFMKDIETRNKSRQTPHHVTIMWAPQWGVWLAEKQERYSVVSGWIAAGHEMAFHSHTHNHSYRDGYTNASSFVADTGQIPCLSSNPSECTLDFGVQKVEGAMALAAGRSVDLRFGAIGPRGNGGGYWGRNDNTCVESGKAVSATDETGCIDAEWNATIDTHLENVTDEYPGVTEATAKTKEAVLGTSACARYGVAKTDIYSLPHAAFWTESSKTSISLSALKEAIASGNGSHFIGVVIHPASYVAAATNDSANGIADVTAVFDWLDDSANANAPLASRTLSETRLSDTSGGGAACRDTR